MGVKIEKSVFEQLIKKFVNEHNNSRTAHSTRIDQIAGPELPVLPNEHMPLQLSSEMPNVADDAYMPTTTSALSDAAATIAQEVPSSQVEFFYNQLHNLLKRVMDREEEARIPMMEAILFEAIDGIEDSIDSFAGEKEGWEDEEEGIDDVELYVDKDPVVEEITSKSIARAIIVNGHTSKDAIHDRTDNMNLNVGDVKSASANFASFGHKTRKATIPSALANEVFFEAVRNDKEIKKMFSDYVDTGINQSIAALDVISELTKQMSAVSDISVEDASEMHANTTYDKLKKSITEEDEQTIEEVVDEVINNIKNGPKVLKLQLRGLEGSYDVPSDMFISHLEAAKKKNAPAAMSKEVADEEFGSEEEKDLEAAEALFDVDRAEKRLESNLENQSDLFGFTGANGIRQWFQKHPEQKFMTLVKGGVGVSGEKMYDQTYSALEALIMSPGVEKWLKKIAKKAPKGIKPEAVEKVITGIEAIIGDVTTGSEEIDFDKLTGTSAGWIVRGAFDKLLLGKTFGTFFNNRRDFGLDAVSNLNIDDKKKRALGDILAGISKNQPAFDKNGTPQNSSAKKVLEAGITIEEFKGLQGQMDKKIQAYFDDHITDIKGYYNKQLQDDGAIVSAFDRAVVDIRDNIEEMMAEKDVKTTLDAEREEQQQ
tara:strand:+ start:1631 stop:3592 length:1962 start_codon:yes stop_codon:yes gene_type:complete